VASYIRSTGGEGVCIVYGHRNRNYFLVLKDIEIGDEIMITMQNRESYTYFVESTKILENDQGLRIPTVEGHSLVLVTCYPFRYTGHAPRKYLVLAKKL